MEVSVTNFKAHCLGIVEKVQREHESVVITRFGQPAAVLIPAPKAQRSTIFGKSRGQAQIVGELITTDESWDAASE